MPVPGSRLDRFEIRELLGAGGMGEVWRAHDARLNRDVALKLLPESFLQDAERRARFERETQVLASLNHPNIGALFEVVALRESHVLVLELVEGQTLSERIAGGVLPVPEALGIATQIAAALEAAHERGIVHRDLKAGNVQIRPDGTVKLLDFGLAKIFDQPETRGAADVTLTIQGAPGLASERILGSPAYMSPEQARGLPVDRRTDIWAFGCLLYEMLCGRRAFAGERAQEVLARILEREPDFSLLPPDLPRPVEKLLRRCLEKDRRQRLRDIGDARLELLDALAHPETGPAITGPHAPGAHRTRRALFRGSGWKLVALVTLAAVAIGLLLQATREAPPQVVTRFTIPEGGNAGAGLALSPDGHMLAYVTWQGLVVRALDHLDSRLVASNNLVQGNPFFSPDGQWVGFRGWESLRRVSIAGGAVETLADRIYPAGDWAGKDEVLFGDARGLFRIAAAGGVPEQLLATSGIEQVVAVEALPDREAVLFTVIPTRGNSMRMAASSPAARIEALDMRTGKRHLVLRGGGRPRLTPTGHLLYASGNTIYAVAFDLRALETRGEAVPVVTAPGMIDFDVSDNGTLAYQNLSGSEARELVWVDRRGIEEPLGAPARGYIYPRISPDGARVALDMNEPGVERNVWVWDLRRATLERFTKDPAHHPIAAWSPDGRYLYYGGERSGASKVYRQAADGSGTEELLLDSDELQMPVSFVPDGRLLVSVGAGPQRDIHLMQQLDGERRLLPLIQGPANELTAEVSPDGRWVAYDSDESGQFEVYVRPFPGADDGSRWQVSIAGGRQPLWSRDGRELFYRSFDGAVMSVAVTPGATFEAGRARRLFEGSAYSGGGSQGGGRTYDVAPDGKRFLMVKLPPAGKAPELVVVLNWFEELGRLAPLD